MSLFRFEPAWGTRELGSGNGLIELTNRLDFSDSYRFLERVAKLYWGKPGELGEVRNLSENAAGF